MCVYRKKDNLTVKTLFQNLEQTYFLFHLLQGRGRNTHAYTHSVNLGHRVYLNLETKKFYCLPDNYEIIDPSLSDIVYVLDPTFSQDLIRQVEKRDKEVRAFCGTMYLPGVVGLNNIKVNFVKANRLNHKKLF